MAQEQINPALFALGSDDIRSLIEEFLIVRKTDRECSPKTLLDYLAKLSLFVRFLQLEAYPLDIREVTPTHIRGYRSYLQQASRWDGKTRAGKPLTDSSRAAYDRVLRTFFRWLEEEDLIDTNPIKGIPKPRVKRAPMRFLSTAELETLWKGFDPKSRVGQRDRTLFLLLTDTGVRASELLGITLEHVNLAEKTILVTGKGGHTRVVGMSKTTVEQIIRYVRQSRQKCSDTHLLLHGSKRKPLTYFGLQMVFERWMRATGIPPFSAHSFRRTYATRAIREGADGMLVAAQMGHTTLAMTKKYIQEAGLDLGKLQAEHSPLKGLKL